MNNRKSIIILSFLVLVISIGFFLLFTQRNNKNQTQYVNNPTSKPLQGFDRAVFLLNTSSYAKTFVKDSLFYEVPQEYVLKSQGYKTNSTVIFGIYELKSETPGEILNEWCDQFKRDMAIGEEYTTCSTNGSVLFLGFAKQQDQKILEDITQSFAGEE